MSNTRWQGEHEKSQRSRGGRAAFRRGVPVPGGAAAPTFSYSAVPCHAVEALPARHHRKLDRHITRSRPHEVQDEGRKVAAKLSRVSNPHDMQFFFISNKLLLTSQSKEPPKGQAIDTDANEQYYARVQNE